MSNEFRKWGKTEKSKWPEKAIPYKDKVSIYGNQRQISTNKSKEPPQRWLEQKDQEKRASKHKECPSAAQEWKRTKARHGIPKSRPLQQHYMFCGRNTASHKKTEPEKLECSPTPEPRFDKVTAQWAQFCLHCSPVRHKPDQSPAQRMHATKTREPGKQKDRARSKPEEVLRTLAWWSRSATGRQHLFFSAVPSISTLCQFLPAAVTKCLSSVI